jgi:GNAT superfamily N-acetyltransferase
MLTIRKAGDGDIPGILQLYKQLSFTPGEYGETPVEDCRKVLYQIEQNPITSLLVAEENGETVGTVFMLIIPSFAFGTAPYAIVDYMVVDETRRSRGIGKALMEYCIARAKEAGCYKVMLTSDKRRDRAHKFYRSIGFESSAEGFRYYF